MHQPPDLSDAAMAKALRLLEQLRPALDAHDRAATVEIITQLVGLRPVMGRQWPALARLASQDGEITLSRRAMDIFVEQEGGSPTAQYEKAGLLAEQGAWAEAHAALCRLPDHVPDAASYAHSRGTAAMFCGKHEEAREFLLRAADLHPRSGASWQSLATLVDFAGDDLLAQRIMNHEPAMENGAPSQRGLYYHALGKVHSDRAEHALAFGAFTRGTALLRQNVNYSAERDARMAQGAVEGFDAQSIAAIASQQTKDTGRTIFVTGMPRSGTTLLEQVLASHSAVSDGGETNRLGLLVKDIQGVSQDALSAHLDKVTAPAVAKQWHHWMRECFPGNGRVVDSTNNSSRMIGLAASLLPDAPLVWITRDPLDCAWSCLRTHFQSGNPWSYDQQDIARHMQLEDSLREHWQQVLADRLLTISYADLVTEPDRQIARILAHCGLPMEQQTLRPHETRRTVATSSVMQVRQPINRKGLGSAQPYATFLEPFQKAYFG